MEKRCVIIETCAGDTHASTIAAALLLLGHSVEFAYSTEFPSFQARSVDFHNSEWALSFPWLPPHIGEVSISAYWHRRPAPPNPDVSMLHPGDREYVAKTLRAFDAGTMRVCHEHLRGLDVLMVNEPSRARIAESKICQLACAADLGWEIPETLISNEPARIRDFVRGRPEVIHKSLVHHGWHDADGTRFPRTAKVTEDVLPSDDILRASPGIFQEKIQKRSELRIFCFGRSYLALEIAPGRAGMDALDWRDFHAALEGTCRRTEISRELHDACLAMMARMGLVTASFDIMIDTDGRPIFAELNQAGQFLWLERHGIPVVDAFSQFLVSGSAEFVWDGTSRISCAEVVNSNQYCAIEETESFNRCAPDAAVAGKQLDPAI